ncbi:TRAP transporter small permease [Synergistaceae bacterium OttesenSCG-928-I11]|nr:TRAP transporter small permease [Synergistaceae bacterium OttesenSCG-928-I11]
MCSYIKKCSDILDRIYKPIAIIFLVVLTASCVIQVFTRLLNASPSWTEEVARYCFIWINMLGASILSKKKGHAAIDFFVKNLKGVKRRIHTVVISVITLIAAGVLIYYSVLLIPVVAQQLSPATGIPMSYVYMAVPVGSAGIFIHALSDMFNVLFPDKPE